MYAALFFSAKQVIPYSTIKPVNRYGINECSLKRGRGFFDLLFVEEY